MSDDPQLHEEQIADPNATTGDSLPPQQLDLPLETPHRVDCQPELVQLWNVDNSSHAQSSAPLFVSYEELSENRIFPAAPSRELPIVRSPNFLDLLLFAALLLLGALVSAAAQGLAIHLHWFGLHSAVQAEKITGVTLATEVLWYAATLAAAIPIFRAVWRRGYFAGIHWHAATAYRRRYWLVGAAVFGNVLAIVGGELLKFPDHAPVDQLFSSTIDAWLIFAFGVTVAPFMEEMGFRGFLLPAIATGWDWCAEKLTASQPRPLDGEGNPVWSVGAMIFASLLVSAPFALIHGPQVGKALGPLVLLYCVSLILCSVRLITRSLAASTLVHSAYNFILFAMMLVQTDGFRHLDKM